MMCGRRNLKIIDLGEARPPKKKKMMMKEKKINPYSTVGRDKFSDLLADLEARRARIMANAAGSPEEAASMSVQFTYTASNDCVPVVVRRKDVNTGKQFDDSQSESRPAAVKLVLVKQEEPPPLVDGAAEERAVEKERDAAEGVSPDYRKVMKKSLSWCVEEVMRGWPWRMNWLIPALVLIPCCLLMFGKAFAICCTTVWWYLVPLMEGDRGEISNKRCVRKKKKKKKIDEF
ncbi:hypothetical protein Cni_G26432 [Canna indica]|uniref:Uncharacterized protein n=1 Tax=Canna indica TaxID=4628 RepID=A0AAQ3QND4_9LILI|nr:hypothetical protein Cni_G26432 [Canna indica]